MKLIGIFWSNKYVTKEKYRRRITAIIKFFFFSASCDKSSSALEAYVLPNKGIKVRLGILIIHITWWVPTVCSCNVSSPFFHPSHLIPMDIGRVRGAGSSRGAMYPNHISTQANPRDSWRIFTAQLEHELDISFMVHLCKPPSAFISLPL